jgi:Leucine-rich repeat (LRR) protein
MILCAKRLELTDLPSVKKLVVGDEGYESVSVTGLTGLIELTLDGCGTDARSSFDAFLQDIASWQKLQVLAIEACVVSESSMMSIGALKNLRKLSLWESNVSDCGIQELGSLTNLRELNLAQTDISDMSLRTIAKMQQLRVLELWSCKNITDGAVDDIIQLVNLQGLDIVDTQITWSGKARIRSALGDALAY